MARLKGAIGRWRARRRALQISYTPSADGRPDPGEVVWAWVPYEEDPRQGKDRPLIVIGRAGRELVAVPLSSQDRTHSRYAREWVAVGPGRWDRSGRVSFAHASRMFRFAPGAVRREGATLSRDRFDAVVERVRELHPGVFG